MITQSPKRIGRIAFSLLDPQEIRDMSATKVITADTYDDDGFPIDMGLMDPRLGVVEPGLRCKTCGRSVGDCPGHFGHIDLAMPVIHVGYTKTIKNILRSTCRSCGRILLTDDTRDNKREELKDWVDSGKDKQAFVKSVIKQARKVNKSGDACPHCGETQRKIDYEKPTTFREEEHKLTPVDVREWLESVPNDDLDILGVDPEVARPEWMVLTVLPVPPVTMRPSITLESGERSEDDLTHKMVDVIRINQRLQENRDAGAPQLIVEDLWELLQYHVTTYMDNQTSGIPPARHRSGRELKTLSQRLKGKEGRFRQNLSGKRVNFSARTVISPDPNLSINEVGVPRSAAKELTIPTKVTPYNIEWARDLTSRGPNTHPGVNYVIREDGRRLKVTDENAEEVAKRLEPGFVVERHLVDGDICLFNRQPSLHRMSIMAHEVRVMPHKTFRLNLSVCPPYNADFDGDEMNLHVLQGEEARAEARTLMRVQEHVLSPRFGGPIVGGIHDHISGAVLLTFRDPLFNQRETAHLLSHVDIGTIESEPAYEAGEELPDGTTAEEPHWSGKQVFSHLLPGDLSLRYKPEMSDPDRCIECDCPVEDCPWDGYTTVEDGELVHGAVDEKGLGAFTGEILNHIVRKYGNDRARQFINHASRLCIAAIMVRGFSAGLDDADIPEEARDQINEMLGDARGKVEELVDAYNEGLLEQMPGRSLEETLELQIMQELGQARDRAGEIAGKHLGFDNPIVIMAQSGARGSMLNLSQMAGSVGQQAVRGERVQRGFEERTLSHFPKGDLGADAKGFVASSYKEGLNPTEFFFHSMGGREGLVDTAVRTARSGYMQRRLINALEDLSVDYDGTVRNTTDTIIQFVYGEDGVDPTRSLRGKALNVKEVVEDTLDIETEPEETTRGESTYDREDVELQRSAQDEADGFDEEFGGER
jgi:DNA-directed RNA polymerase subunit A'